MAARQEEWRDINGYEGLYQISNTGHVRSLPRIVITRRNGKQARIPIAGKMLQPGKVQGGLQVVCLSKANRRKTYSLARLVMVAHGPPAPTGHQAVRHKDGDHSNNSVRNLEWMGPAPTRHDDTKAWRSLADRLMPGCSLEIA